MRTRTTSNCVWGCGLEAGMVVKKKSYMTWRTDQHVNWKQIEIERTHLFNWRIYTYTHKHFVLHALIYFLITALYRLVEFWKFESSFTVPVLWWRWASSKEANIHIHQSTTNPTHWSWSHFISLLLVIIFGTKGNEKEEWEQAKKR